MAKTLYEIHICLMQMNLVGGYYDAGYNVKFGLPMAYTVTMLAWSVVEFGSHFEAGHELKNALEAIKWGTDYLLRAHPKPNILYGEIDDQHPGSDLAGIAFLNSDRRYSSQLINHAKQLFDFATKRTGVYQNSIPVAGQFYSSSGYEFIKSTNSGGTRGMFSWDDKYAGAQVLFAKQREEKQWRAIVVPNVNSLAFLMSTYADVLAKTKSTIQCPGGHVGSNDLLGFARNSDGPNVLEGTTTPILGITMPSTVNNAPHLVSWQG
ncbi:hypothetical protein SASPL_123352 [Salvia splendens]|uniref:cellulase n=1 Tax=Salvia splendens TaxID=180675 RepID=A0A8X8ZT42_SALSN|nr:hypothetical protein SASPL_123352 [Salvia splendens]